MNSSILTDSQINRSAQAKIVRQFFSNPRSRSRNGNRPAQRPQNAPAATYFELLMSLPAKRTLPQLLHA